MHGERSSSIAANMAMAAWPLGILEIDCDGGVSAANPAVAELLAPFGQEAWTDFLRWLHRSLPESSDALAALGEGAVHRRSLNSAAGTRIGLSVLRHGGGFTVLVSDETQLARAEEEAHRQRTRFAALADALGGPAVFTLDREGRITGWSASAETLESLSSSEAIGLPFDLLLARSHLGLDTDTLLTEAARSRVATVNVMRLDSRRGLQRVAIEVRAVRAMDGAMDGYVVTMCERDHHDARETELRRLADTDHLTGVLNRRAFTETASAACALSRSQGLCFAVVVFDLDFFKTINDRFGHAGGDAALEAMADAARRDLRSGDLIGRLGGDEFAIALPRADSGLAERIAERLCRSFAALRLRHRGKLLRFTASFGLASSDDPRESYADTLAQADAALYRAKHEGRDRIAIA